MWRPFASMHFLLALAAAFSSGGGNGADEHGIPFAQSCDALYVCEPVCPPGMTAVAPPTRSAIYDFRTEDGSTTYAPGELVTLELEVLERTIPGKRDAGTLTVSNETAKYLGFLLCALPPSCHPAPPFACSTRVDQRCSTCVDRRCSARHGFAHAAPCAACEQMLSTVPSARSARGLYP